MATQKATTTLNVIRFALLGWALAFGVVAWVLAQGSGMAPDLFQGVEQYVWGGLLLVFLALFGGVLSLRSRWQAAEDVAAKKSANITGWALAEAATLLGAAYLLLVGDPTFFGVGIVFQVVASYVLLPMPGR